jgi:hypothetical protein
VKERFVRVCVYLRVSVRARVRVCVCVSARARARASARMTQRARRQDGWQASHPAAIIYAFVRLCVCVPMAYIIYTISYISVMYLRVYRYMI